MNHDIPLFPGRRPCTGSISRGTGLLLYRNAEGKHGRIPKSSISREDRTPEFHTIWVKQLFLALGKQRHWEARRRHS